MTFNTWFTMALKDGSLHKSEVKRVVSQEQFIQFVQLMANYIFGEEVIAELVPSDDLTAVTKEQAGSCPVRLKVQGPATENKTFHYFEINDLRFNWEPHAGSVNMAREWERIGRREC